MSNAAANSSEVVKKTDEKEEKVVVRINVEETLPFEANVKSSFVNTIELCSALDSLFAPSMRDYVGCKISLNTGDIRNPEIPVNRLYASLYFKERTGESNCPIANVKTRSASKGKNKFDSLMMMSGDGAGRMYDVTPETYEALDEFRFNPNKKINQSVWNTLTSETTSNFGFPGSYNQEIVVCITGLSLDAIINKIYGTRTKDGIFQYQCVPVQFVANANGEYVVQITQLDLRKLEDLRKSLGGPVNNTDFHRCVR